MPLGLTDNLFKRIIAALILVPPVVYMIYAGGVWFYALLAVGLIPMCLEWCALTKLPTKIYGINLVIFIYMAAYLGLFQGYATFVFLTLLALSLVGHVLKHKQAFGWWLLGTGYVGLTVISLGWLRGQEEGALLVFWVFLVTWATDVGGYFFGKAIGGPKMAPIISPNKTWSGLFGGMALSGVVSLVITLTFDWHDPITIAVLSGLVAVLSQLGDLYESAIKRSFNQKDSGVLIPGHGGILDRVDGLVFTTPTVAIVVYYLSTSGI